MLLPITIRLCMLSPVYLLCSLSLYALQYTFFNGFLPSTLLFVILFAFPCMISHSSTYVLQNLVYNTHPGFCNLKFVGSGFVFTWDFTLCFPVCFSYVLPPLALIFHASPIYLYFPPYMLFFNILFFIDVRISFPEPFLYVFTNEIFPVCFPFYTCLLSLLPMSSSKCFPLYTYITCMNLLAFPYTVRPYHKGTSVDMELRPGCETREEISFKTSLNVNLLL